MSKLKLEVGQVERNIILIEMKVICTNIRSIANNLERVRRISGSFSSKFSIFYFYYRFMDGIINTCVCGGGGDEKKMNNDCIPFA